MKRLMCIVTVLVLCLSLVTISASAEGKASLKFATNWGPGDAKYDYFEPLYNEYVDSVKDTADIQIETLSTADYKTKIKVEMASGELPDVFTWWGGALLKDMVDSDLLLNVDDYFAASKAVTRDQFVDGSFGYYTLGGSTYGIPLEGTRSLFLANSELFKKYNLAYPTTFEELKACNDVFKANGIITLAIGSNGGEPSSFFYSELYNQFPGAADELNNLSTSMKFDTDNALKTADAIAQMRDLGMFPEDTVANGGWSASLQLFVDGKAAMTYTYPWMFDFISEDMQAKTDIIPVPMMDGATNNPADFLSGFTVYGFCINKASFNDPAKHDALVALCDFLASDKLTAALTQSGMVPDKKVDVDWSKAKPIMQKLMAYCEGKTLTSVHFTVIPDNATVNIFNSALDELFVGALTPQEYVAKVQAELDKAK